MPVAAGLGVRAQMRRNVDDGRRQVVRAMTSSRGRRALFVAAAVVIAVSLTSATLLAKRVVVKLPAERFRLAMDALLLVSGATMLWAAGM